MADFNTIPEYPFSRPYSGSSSIYSQDMRALHAASIYSQDTRPASPTTPTPLLPPIARQDSVRSTAASSTVSKAPTIYSEETIKSLGYRPFEYWKGPKRTPYPAKHHMPQQQKKARVAVTITLVGNNNTNNHINHGQINNERATQQISSPPRARFREGLVENGTTDVDSPPPTSPTVKDRYRHRHQQLQRQKQNPAAWLHWISLTHKTDRRQQERQRFGGGRRGWTQIEEVDEEKAVASDDNKNNKRTRTGACRSWTSCSCSWRCRTWGIIIILLVLCAVGAVVTVVNLPLDKLTSST
ncbi:hypothetical protein BD289DRAFT_7408 [Coniella lustricola]|uniref:Uncharacterized protein n=1 Tax=Coniella lustricola TaxID=2025994 RepID=A0A2T3AJN9_9PEZI|nr:hypothetical protein BD289DRAFT_7408 [Coniella lustricola]